MNFNHVFTTDHNCTHLDTILEGFSYRNLDRMVQYLTPEDRNSLRYTSKPIKLYLQIRLVMAPIMQQTPPRPMSKYTVVCRKTIKMARSSFVKSVMALIASEMVNRAHCFFLGVGRIPMFEECIGRPWTYINTVPVERNWEPDWDNFSHTMWFQLDPCFNLCPGYYPWNTSAHGQCSPNSTAYLIDRDWKSANCAPVVAVNTAKQENATTATFVEPAIWLATDFVRDPTTIYHPKPKHKVSQISLSRPLILTETTSTPSKNTWFTLGIGQQEMALSVMNDSSPLDRCAEIDICSTNYTGCWHAANCPEASSADVWDLAQRRLQHMFPIWSEAVTVCQDNEFAMCGRKLVNPSDNPNLKLPIWWIEEVRKRSDANRDNEQLLLMEGGKPRMTFTEYICKYHADASENFILGMKVALFVVFDQLWGGMTRQIVRPLAAYIGRIRRLGQA